MNIFMIPNKHYSAFTAFLLLMGHDPIKIAEDVLYKEWLQFVETLKQQGKE